MAKTYYTHPQETWSEKECAKRARYRGTDSYGSKHPYAGLIASSASSRAQYGQTVTFNGGFIAPDGEWYNGEIRPLPIIPDSFEFHKRISWGTYIRKKP